MGNIPKSLIAVLVLALVIALNGCGINEKPSAVGTASNQQPQASGQNAAGNEQPVAPEQNSAGDIPDNQAFVKFDSPSGGYQLEAPEGWARTNQNTDVSFINKLDGLQLSITNFSTPFSLDNIRSNQVAELEKTGRAVQVKQVQSVQLQSGPAVQVVYESNSEPDSVTGKQVRLENNRYYFYKNGKLATLTVWAPLGADNVDQWKYMSNSFRWR